MQITFNVNGSEIELEVSPKERLLDILRDRLQLTGTKESCGKGECGACTVLLNGRPVNSCLVPAAQIDGAKVVTIEGVRQWEGYPAIERAYLEHGAVQCGFCTPGFVMSTVGFLTSVEEPVAEEEVKTNFGGNICRCTGYEKIFIAIEELANDDAVIEQIREDWENAFENK